LGDIPKAHTLRWQAVPIDLSHCARQSDAIIFHRKTNAITLRLG
jgi:hypothetical protein